MKCQVFRGCDIILYERTNQNEPWGLLILQYNKIKKDIHLINSYYLMTKILKFSYLLATTEDLTFHTIRLTLCFITRPVKSNFALTKSLWKTLCFITRPVKSNFALTKSLLKTLCFITRLVKSNFALTKSLLN